MYRRGKVSKDILLTMAYKAIDKVFYQPDQPRDTVMTNMELLRDHITGCISMLLQDMRREVLTEEDHVG